MTEYDIGNGLLIRRDGDVGAETVKLVQLKLTSNIKRELWSLELTQNVQRDLCRFMCGERDKLVQAPRPRTNSPMRSVPVKTEADE